MYELKRAWLAVCGWLSFGGSYPEDTNRSGGKIQKSVGTNILRAVGADHIALKGVGNV